MNIDKHWKGYYLLNINILKFNEDQNTCKTWMSTYISCSIYSNKSPKRHEKLAIKRKNI